MQPRLEVIFCDDVRLEVGHKPSLMGVYVADLIVPEMPIVLSKICAFMKVASDYKNPAKVATFKLILNDEVCAENTVPPIEKEPNPLPDLGVPYSVSFVYTILALNAFEITSECVFKTVAETDKGTLAGPSLRIRNAQNLPK